MVNNQTNRSTGSLQFRTGKLSLLALVFMLTGCIPPYSQEEPPPGAIGFETYPVGSGGLSYAVAGTSGGQVVVFIHGTPGSWHAFSDFLLHPELGRRARLIAIDRPGFGRSANLGVTPGLKQQSLLLKPLITRLANEHPLILVGHSLGGSLAYQLAADYPESVAGIVVVSASLAPELGRPRWFNRLASLTPVQWLLPMNLKQANSEIMPLAAGLSALVPRLAEVEMPVTVIHGEKDVLVSVENVEFATQVLRSSDLHTVVRPQAGHFLLWEEPHLVVEQITAMLDATGAPGNDG